MHKVKNPLEISAVPSSKVRWANNSGRPRASNIIRFSAEHKSIVSTELITSSKLVSLKLKHIKNTCTSDLDLTNESTVTQFHTIDIRPTILSENKPLHSNKKIEQTGKSSLYACDYPECTYTCKLSCNLIKHKRTHSNDRPYVCDKCTFRTKFGNSLKVHRRIHTSERPYSCDCCPYRCNSSSNLKKHYFHRHSENPNLIINIPNKTFDILKKSIPKILSKG